MSANLCSVSLQHIKHLTRERRPAPFIGIDGNEIVNRLRMHFARIRGKRKEDGSPIHCITFTAGFDGTVLVKSFQVLHLSNVAVGGACPNHSILILPGSSAVEMGKLLKDCVNGNKYGEPAAETKVCIISFQDRPPGMCPYFTIVGQRQTVNENNDFGKIVMDVCVTACNEDGSSVVLNMTTDGVASKVQ